MNDARADRIAAWAAFLFAFAIILRDWVIGNTQISYDWITLAAFLGFLTLVRGCHSNRLRRLAVGLLALFALSVSFLVLLLYMGRPWDLAVAWGLLLLTLLGLRQPAISGALLTVGGIAWGAATLSQLGSSDPATALLLVLLLVLPPMLGGPILLLSWIQSESFVRRPIRRKRH